MPGLPIMKKMKQSDNADDLGPGFLGPNYNYGDYIKTTSEMGMSGKGNFTALGNDIAGLISYSTLLIEGGGKARVGGPLGNRFFAKTGTKCKPSIKRGKKWVADPRYKGTVDRYLWIDNTTKREYYNLVKKYHPDKNKGYNIDYIKFINEWWNEV